MLVFIGLLCEFEWVGVFHIQKPTGKLLKMKYNKRKIIYLTIFLIGSLIMLWLKLIK